MDSAVAGLAWGGFALLLGSRAFGPELWGGVLVSPLMGMLVGSQLQRPFEAHHGWRRALVALGSLYLSATLFGTALGVTAYLLLPGPLASVVIRISEHTVAVWWGVTMTGFLLFLWPLAWATHWLVEWRGS